MNTTCAASALRRKTPKRTRLFIVSKNNKPKTLIVCVNRRLDPGRPSCAARGSEKNATALEKGISDRGIDIEVERIVCLGHCADGPTMRLAPGGAFFHNTKLEDIPGILDDLELQCARSRQLGPEAATTAPASTTDQDMNSQSRKTGTADNAP